MTYAEKLKDPRWQKKRLKILERDEWTCQKCFDTETTLHIHHKYYKKNFEPWDYPSSALITLCSSCHDSEKIERLLYEKDIIEALRKNFLAYDMMEFALGFDNMTLCHIPNVIANAFRFALEDETTQKKVIDIYFQHLRNSQK